MEVVGETLSKEQIGAIKADIRRRVDALPQRELILASDIRQWIDAVVAQHGEQAIWHAIRLNGFGGSEIGVLVRNQYGQRADHQASAHDIVLGKLMRKIPDETNEHMTRGHENEDTHALKFYKKYGAHRDIEAFDKLKAAQGRLPWMRYSPDEVVLIPSKLLACTRDYASVRPWSRFLADYKAPSKVDPDEDIHFQYGCQLAQGAILCDEQGIELHGTMLSQYDWAGWRLKDDVVPVTDELKAMVRSAGSFYWDHVMRGEVPAYIRTPVLAGSEDFALKNAPLAEAVAQSAALAGAADERSKELRSTLMKRLGDQRFAGSKIVFPGAGVMSAVTKVDAEALQEVLTDEQYADIQETGSGYDAKKMEERLRSLGQLSKDLRAKKVDADKLFERAQEFGIDPEKYAVETVVFRLDKQLKETMENYIDSSYPMDVAQAPVAALAPPAVPDPMEDAEAVAEAPRA